VPESVAYYPIMCNHCVLPAWRACPVGGAIYKRTMNRYKSD
jgi:nitrate reductase beta subunit